MRRLATRIISNHLKKDRLVTFPGDILVTVSLLVGVDSRIPGLRKLITIMIIKLAIHILIGNLRKSNNG